MRLFISFAHVVAFRLFVSARVLVDSLDSGCAGRAVAESGVSCPSAIWHGCVSRRLRCRKSTPQACAQGMWCL